MRTRVSILNSFLYSFRNSDSLTPVIFFFASFKKLIYLLGGYYFTILCCFLPYIDMNQPWVYMSSPSWTPLSPPSPSHYSCHWSELPKHISLVKVAQMSSLTYISVIRSWTTEENEKHVISQVWSQRLCLALIWWSSLSNILYFEKVRSIFKFVLHL